MFLAQPLNLFKVQSVEFVKPIIRAIPRLQQDSKCFTNGQRGFAVAR
jgi:hypothetical protein